MKLIFKEKSYDETLVITNLPMLKNYTEQLCKLLFEKMQNPEHMLNSLLREPCTNTHGLRYKYNYQVPKVRTERCKSGFVYYALFNYQYSFLVLPIHEFNILFILYVCALYVFNLCGCKSVINPLLFIPNTMCHIVIHHICPLRWCAY